MIFARIAKAAERRDRLPAGIMTRARAEELGAVGLGPARQTRIIKLGALSDHQPRRLKIHPAFRERMLNPLILADQTAEYDALLRIGDRSEEHTSELQSLMRISYAVFCLKKQNTNQ